MTVKYVGNGAYCYANSVTMALRVLGHEVDPGYVECLTAFGVGAQLEESPTGALPFFDAAGAAPDRGVIQALQTLGYAFEHHYSTVDADPEGGRAFNMMAEWLQDGPVIVGPVDMGLLTYNPNHRYANGADHYVLVYGLDEVEVHLHDPAGFPYVSMKRAEFVKAWQAESITYRMGSYSMWGHLRRVAEPTADELFAATDQKIAQQYRWQQEHCKPDQAGPGAFRALAERVLEEVPPALLGHLVHFALPVAARRCDGFAAFYAPYDAQRAEIKRAQARCFGRSQVELMRGDHQALAARFRELADLEERFRAECCDVSAEFRKEARDPLSLG